MPTFGESEWHVISHQGAAEVHCMRVSLDTYKLRTMAHTITLNAEGFNAYREGAKEFAEWYRAHPSINWETL